MDIGAPVDKHDEGEAEEYFGGVGRGSRERYAKGAPLRPRECPRVGRELSEEFLFFFWGGVGGGAVRDHGRLRRSGVGLAEGLARGGANGDPRVHQKRFVAANGHETKGDGRKRAQFRRQGCADVISLGLDVTNIAKSLVAVRRIVEKGSEVRLLSAGRQGRQWGGGDSWRWGSCYMLKVDLIVVLQGFTCQS